MNSPEYWIQKLNLKPHPEGGFYSETYRSTIEIPLKSLPKGFPGDRRLSTIIYFLLRSEDVSKFHRLRSDEIWFFHTGSPLKIYLLDKEGKKLVKLLGPNPEKAEHFQIEISSGSIFAAELLKENSFALMSCLVSPGFDFSDFEMFDAEDLKQAYPKHTALIDKFS